MILFFQTQSNSVIAVHTKTQLQQEQINKLSWAFGEAKLLESDKVSGFFIGPRREMLSPWSTNASEILETMGINDAIRLEEFHQVENKSVKYDPLLEQLYENIDKDIFRIDRAVEPILEIDNIDEYNKKEGLALSPDEVSYLENLSKKLDRKLTDSEVFGFSQVNSEHCRHKIFNGEFIIDGEKKENSLFQLIKKTSKTNPNKLVSAYKDNVSFNAGPKMEQFAPSRGDQASIYETKEIESVLSLKAETHNFPTTVEPYNGAATGAGGEIRDRLGGGRASLPLAGISVYMTAYPRVGEKKNWENKLPERPWLYQSPAEILIKASNGAADFGSKYGQPLICGSLLSFEHQENNKKFAFDKVIMLAGGIGYANKRDAIKGEPKAGEKIVVLGGDNYRIGMGGGAVSSVDTGEMATGIELNAVQRSNPEIQKRATNVIRALAESDDNPIISIHDHGAGGHLNCLSELVEKTGGKIDISKLPVGDPSLSSKEIVGNESQERMGLLIEEKDLARLEKIAERERANLYVVGETTNDIKLVFEQADGKRPIDLSLSDLFGKTPETVMEDKSVEEYYENPDYDQNKLADYIKDVLQLEAVACKDWIINKTDRSASGKVARQQSQGQIQLPLSDLGAMALDFRGYAGIATSIGHAPQAAMIDAAAGSLLAIAEALTNIIFAPLADGLASVSLSANWMWPCKNEGEDARLYSAVEACSDFACELGINIPTGKDSLSMTQVYEDEKVYSPGTVIITAAAELSNIRKIVSPNLAYIKGTYLYYIDFSFDTFKLGGSAFAQTQGKLGEEVPMVNDSEYFKNAFTAVQELVNRGLVIAGHDVSAGGLVTTLLEMCFANIEGGIESRLEKIRNTDLIKILFSENPGIVIQVKHHHLIEKVLDDYGVGYAIIGRPIEERKLVIQKDEFAQEFDIDELRDVWFQTSYDLDKLQSGEELAKARFDNYKKQVLDFKFPNNFRGRFSDLGLNPDRKEKSGIIAAVIRDKGTNSERETAYALHIAGFDVKDVHMTDLTSGRETLEDVSLIVFAGGSSNSDVLGPAKGWAAGFKYSEKAKNALQNFYLRPDTLSLGICNGCQLMIEMGLITPEHEDKPQILRNPSNKFEASYLMVDIPKNNSVMLSSLAGSKLGVWIAHNNGKFALPMDESNYQIPIKYSYKEYPANPNDSDYQAAAICSADGRHLAMMSHLERSIFPWQNAYYPYPQSKDDATPWVQAFVNALEWIRSKR